MKQHPLEIQGRKSIVRAFLNKKEKQNLANSIHSVSRVGVDQWVDQGRMQFKVPILWILGQYLDSLLHDSCPQPSQEEKTKRPKSLLIISFHPGVVTRDHVDGAN